MTDDTGTRKKRVLPLRERTPVFVNREAGAAELCISVSTWNDLVRMGKLPPPTVWLGKSGTTPRWLWTDVLSWLTGRSFDPATSVPTNTAVSATTDKEPFFRELPDGKTRSSKKCDRQPARRRTPRPQAKRADLFLLSAGAGNEDGR